MPDRASGAGGALPHVAAPGDMLAPARTALLVVDVQVDFAAPHGAIGRAGGDMAPAEAAIDRIAALIAAARAAGVAIAFARVMTRPETDSIALRTWTARRGAADAAAICRIGSGGEAYHRVAPAPGDIEIAKLGYSSFHGTDLAARLRARGIDTVAICGLTTDCCIDSTARDAFRHDFHGFVVSDACASDTPAHHLAALDALHRHTSLLVTSDAAIAAWSPA